MFWALTPQAYGASRHLEGSILDPDRGAPLWPIRDAVVAHKREANRLRSTPIAPGPRLSFGLVTVVRGTAGRARGAARPRKRTPLSPIATTGPTEKLVLNRALGID